MLSLSTATRIFVALDPVDMRQSFNGLYARVQTVLQEEPTSGHWFVFTNKPRNRLKILFWDGSGLFVCANMHAPQCAVIKGRKSSLSLSSFIR
jgi:transposase